MGITLMSKSVLVVDDEETALHTMRDDLKAEGYRVDVSSSGKDAIKKFEDNEYDVVITDLVMEEVSGIQVARAVKKIKPKTIIIVLTAYGSRDTAIDSLRLGVSDYFLKPYKKKDLLDKVETCLTELNKPLASIDVKFKQFELTPREREIVLLIIKGNTTKEISEVLFVCNETVKGHMKNIHCKMGVCNRAQLLSKINNE